MKRDCYRDAATLAFVRYGELKGKTADEYKDKLKQDIINEVGHIDPALVNQRIDSEMKKYNGFFEDLYAVEETLGYFMDTQREFIADAVYSVYISPSHYPSHRETVCYVRKFALSVPVSEKQVYKWLEMARTLYAKKRGLAFEVPPGFAGSRS